MFMPYNILSAMINYAFKYTLISEISDLSGLSSIAFPDVITPKICRQPFPPPPFAWLIEEG